MNNEIGMAANNAEITDTPVDEVDLVAAAKDRVLGSAEKVAKQNAHLEAAKTAHADAISALENLVSTQNKGV